MKKPEVGLRLVRDLAQRLHDSEARYADMIAKDVPARLATQILSLVDSEGVVSRESYRIPTHYTHEQLASIIGCKRVVVTRAFSKLRGRRGSRARGSAHRGQGHRRQRSWPRIDRG